MTDRPFVLPFFVPCCFAFLQLNLSHNALGGSYDEFGFWAPESRVVKAIADALAVTPLQKLDLSRNMIDGGEGGAALAEALRSNTALTCLNLAENFLGDTSWDATRQRPVAKAVYAFAEALEQNSTLLDLDLSRNGVLDDGVVRLDEALNKNVKLKSLELGGNNVITLVRMLSALPASCVPVTPSSTLLCRWSVVCSQMQSFACLFTRLLSFPHLPLHRPCGLGVHSKGARC